MQDSKQLELDFNYESYCEVLAWHGAPPFTESQLAKMVYKFEWQTTPQGHEYWHKVFRLLQRYEGEGLASYEAEYDNMGAVLLHSFIFSETDEGTDYWFEVLDGLRNIDIALDNSGSR